MKKRILAIAGVAVLSGILVAISPVKVSIEPVTTEAASETYPTEKEPVNGSCPSGSYQIGERDGEPICKLEPTGCPWGDSVPLDKCSPPPDIICNEDWTKCEPKTNNEGNNGSDTTNDSGSTSSKEEQPSGCYSSK